VYNLWFYYYKSSQLKFHLFALYRHGQTSVNSNPHEDRKCVQHRTLLACSHNHSSQQTLVVLVANRMICTVNAHGNQTGSVVTLWGGKLGKKDSHVDIGNHSNVVINVCRPSCKALFFCLEW